MEMDLVFYNYFKLEKKPEIYIHTCNNIKLILKSTNIKNINGNGIINLSKYLNNFIKISFENDLKYIFAIGLNGKILLKIDTNLLIYKIINNRLNRISEEKFNSLKLGNLRRKSSLKYWHLFWNCIHYVSYIYPDKPTIKDKEQIEKMIEIISTKEGIKCPKCRKHFIYWVSQNDVKMYYNSKNELIKYFVNLHNDINYKNRKKLLSYQEVDKIYKNYDTTELISYYLDIDKFYNNGNVYDFVKNINSFTRQKLLKEFNVIKYETLN